MLTKCQNILCILELPKCSLLNWSSNVTTNTSIRWAGTYMEVLCPDRMVFRSGEQSAVLYCDWDTDWIPLPSNCSSEYP